MATKQTINDALTGSVDALIKAAEAEKDKESVKRLMRVLRSTIRAWGDAERKAFIKRFDEEITRKTNDFHRYNAGYDGYRRKPTPFNLMDFLDND